ncbi:BTAD domain-containing putative transcriptional regulator [Micromonospora globbae]|uniref:BTAD domain-containing putative transcriptional regulator n=1 Tax=Micromonospora globbae TaxID=1894969 RepID=UPI00386FCE83|nr:LysM peptidoglycan-binding domain-containing protein [Micromonospora globbae]
MSSGFVIALTTAAAVMLWLLLATAVLTHAYSTLARRLRWTPTIRLPGPVQGLTAALLGATAVTTATGAIAHANPATTSSDLPAAEPATATPTPHHASQDPRPAAKTPTYTVRRGDSLCRIAAHTLGDADRWTEIFDLNRGTHFPRVGGTLRDPNLIYPGWTLHLPADATPPTRPHPPANTTPANDNGPNEQAAPSRPTPANTRHPAAPTPAATTAPDSSAAAPTTPAGGTASPAADTSRPADRASRGLWLASGSWVDLGLAGAIIAAVTLVWAHRQRRYVPSAPSPLPRLDDPVLAPMPRVVGQVRRGLRRAATVRPDPHEPAPRRTIRNQRSGADNATTSPDSRNVDHDEARADAGNPSHGGFPPVAPALDSLTAADGPDAYDDEPGIVSRDAPEPVTPALASPVIEMWPPAGLGLTGPGAEAAARGFLVSALAAGGLDEPHGRGYVVIPSGTLATLLGAAAVTVPDTPRLTVTGGLTDALTLLEEQTLHRTRVCFDYEVDTTTGLRDADPMAEPLPPMVLIADTTAAHERARIAALLTQGQRLDIHGILLGAWPDGDTVVVAHDGTTSPADGDANRHGRHPADVGRLTVIDLTETADLLRVLAESHTGEPQPPAPAEPAPLPTADACGDTGAADANGGTPHNDEKATPLLESAEPDHEPAVATAASPSNEPDGEPPAAEPPEQDDRGEPGEDDAARPHHDGDTGGTGRVDVRVLGDARVVYIDTTQPLRGKALELLVYLAARGGTASQEAILEDLLPEAASSKAPHRLHTYVYNLRRVLKHTGGPATYLSHPDRRYILHRETVDVDLWRMSDALDEANRATTPADRIAALRRAVHAYQGPLAGSKGYEWIEPYREAVQRQAVDAALALADALDDRPGEALAVLTTAISHHPYAEALYQAAMRAHAALGDATAIRDLHRQLARSLDEIDTEISDETTALARALANRVQPGHDARGKGKHS